MVILMKIFGGDIYFDKYYYRHLRTILFHYSKNDNDSDENKWGRA